MKSSKRALRVPLNDWMLKNLEEDARRLNTTATEYAAFILERRRIAPAHKILRARGALRLMPLETNVTE